MLTSLSLIFLVGLSLATICQRIKIPRIIGMLFTGIILGPCVFNFLDPSILNISPELRQIALIIILIKAGLSLDISDLKKVGVSTLLMAFLPASFEILSFVIFAPLLLNINRVEAAIMGAVLGAVSPAVVVPRMVFLIEKKYGTKKSIPQMILAATSLDDVFVIVLFSTFIGMAQGNGVKVIDFISIPASVVLGIIVGGVVGLFLWCFFETKYTRKNHIRNSTKVIIILGGAFLLIAVESRTEKYISISGLLAVMAMACTLRAKSIPFVQKRLAEKYGKLWIAAEVVLFVLVGAAVDIRYTLKAGNTAIALIFIALIFRSIGVWICVAGTKLNLKEKIYCVISYIPKATVQAAIGSVPLSLGLPCGNIVLSVAVLSILITAPLGAFGMDLTYKILLEKEN
ncbi:MAG: cation:proton antiporter [Treponemataceae bacterium]